MQALEKLDHGKSYRMCTRKLTNAVEQTRKHARRTLVWVETLNETELEEEFENVVKIGGRNVDAIIGLWETQHCEEQRRCQQQ